MKKCESRHQIHNTPLIVLPSHPVVVMINMDWIMAPSLIRCRRLWADLFVATVGLSIDFHKNNEIQKVEKYGSTVNARIQIRSTLVYGCIYGT